MSSGTNHKRQAVAYRVDFRLPRTDGAMAPYTAMAIEEGMARSLAAHLKRNNCAGRLVRVIGKQKFPDGEVIESWEAQP